jgi:adenosylhomocysteine nucleosidase
MSREQVTILFAALLFPTYRGNGHRHAGMVERWGLDLRRGTLNVNDLVFDDPCLLFALGREAASFLREFRPHQRFPGAPCRARFCGPAWLTVLVLETGIGAVRTETALQWLLGRPRLEEVPYRPKVVLSLGFAGALEERFHVGDVLLATEVVSAEGRSWPTTWPGELPPGEWRPPLHRVRLLTTPHLVTSPAEKRSLGEKHRAAAVDMESAIVAQCCQRQGIPFGCVRAVSDDWTTPLSPQLVPLLTNGRVSLVRMLTTLVRSPGLVAELWRLARQTRYASGQLAVAVGELLTLTLPWSGDLNQPGAPATGPS